MAPPWMPLYWGDYLKDTAHLSTTEHGAYLLIIGYYWSRGGRIPDNDGLLANIARMSPAKWAAIRLTVEGFFEIVEDDGVHYWVHARIDRELEEAESRQASAKDRASKAASTRWAKVKHAASNAPSIHHECQSQSQPQPPSNSVAKATGEQASPKEQIFREYLPWMNLRAGKDCRSVLGSLCSSVGDDDALSTLRICREANPMDPVGWIKARMKPRETNDQRKDREIREAIERSKLQ